MTSVATQLAKAVVGPGTVVRSLCAILCLTLFALGAQAQEATSKRVALVIGNGAYQNVPALRNPGNDSADLAAELEALGFEVLHYTDQSQANMLDALRQFRRQGAGADIALIYYAGHGIEIDRQNYLIPVDAVLESDTDVNFEAVTLETMMFAANGAKRLSMVIVDACRDNPFAASMQRSNSSRSIGRGLSAVEPTKNTLVAYAAKEGTTAADGAGRNSPFAKALIDALRRPNLEIGLMMRQVRDDVLKTTSGQQEPFVYGSLSASEIYLNETRGLALVQPEPDTIEPQLSDAGAIEIAFWQSVSRSSNLSDLESYIARYPDGHFVELAQTRIASLADTAPDQDPFQPLVPEVEVDRDIEPNRALTRKEVVELQERLSVLGHKLGTADGIAGKRTKSAIRAFETAENLPATGEAGLTVLLALRERVTDAKLAEWRANRPVPSRTSTATPRKTTTKTTQPKQAVAPEPKAEEAKPAASSSFCRSNKQCATRECRGSGSVPVWRKKRSCQFCSIYVQRCE